MMRDFVSTVVVLALAAPAVAAINPDLAHVRNVYMLPMGQGLDQYMANYLTRSQALQVVTDSTKADAVFTEQLGKDFERRMDELYPPPEVVAAKKRRLEREKAKAAKDGKESSPGVGSGADAVPVDDASFMRSSTFSRGRGNVFLVDVKTRRVLWSFTRRPKNSSPPEVDKAAGNIIERLERDLTPAKPAKQN